jgi:porphobilinogen synthase
MNNSDHSLNIVRRPRRNRLSPSIRALTQETRLLVSDLVAPLFVKETGGEPEPITSMPGQFRYNVADLVKECGELEALGIPAVALFPQISDKHKDDVGSYALAEQNVLFAAIKAVKEAHPELVIISDVALDPYTDHGHDGLVDEKTGIVVNDATVEILCKLSVALVESGADIVAPSDMMDGRIGAIRTALDESGYINRGILAYSAKFASAYYGPFRDAVGSKKSPDAPPLDKRNYQLNPANAREAMLEAQLDEEEGADMLMVKPAGLYLDIIAQMRQQTNLPVAAYQVSGEYAQIHAAAEKGWLNLESTRDESLLAIKRAGADFILTYFAKDIARILAE